VASVSAHATAIKTALAAIASVRAFSEEPDDVQVAAGRAVVFPLLREITYDQAFDGGATYAWDVVVLAAPESAGRARGQQAIDRYVAREGADSIPAALYADATLGGAVDYVKVNRAYDRGLITAGAVVYWGAKLEIETVD